VLAFYWRIRFDVMLEVISCLFKSYYKWWKTEIL